jgi:3-dehydroquinate dehydratase-2
MNGDGGLPWVLVLQGPNLDRLGSREPDRYGRTTLAELSAALDALAASLGLRLRHVQSPHEGELVAAVHTAADDGAVGAIVNAAAYTHTSVALRDALLAVSLPFVEVHLSNVHAREPFRHRSLLSDVALGTVGGLGAEGYGLALTGLAVRLGLAGGSLGLGGEGR